VTIEVGAGDRTYTVSNAADVDRVLDEVTAAITAPALIGLRASATVLHIGVGDPIASVALFRDAQGRPFFAQGANADCPELGVSSFDQDGVARQFDRHSGIAPAEARNAAIDFVTHDGAKPARLHWVAEGRPDTVP
jgi:hypothetical protein